MLVFTCLLISFCHNVEIKKKTGWRKRFCRYAPNSLIELTITPHSIIMIIYLKLKTLIGRWNRHTTGCILNRMRKRNGHMRTP